MLLCLLDTDNLIHTVIIPFILIGHDVNGWCQGL